MSRAADNVENLRSQNPVAAAFSPWEFYPDTISSTRISRIPDRLFVGGAVACTGNLYEPWGSDWLTRGASSSPWFMRNAQFSTLSVNGRIAVLGASRASDIDPILGGVPIGLSGVVTNDADNKTVWGAYIDVTHIGASPTYMPLSTYGIEIDAKNQSVFDSHALPYYHGGGAFGLWIAGGGDPTSGGASTHPSNAAIVILKNSNTWNEGIVFFNDALTGNDGSAGSVTNSSAIRMARRQTIQWDEPTTQGRAVQITSLITDSTKQLLQIFSNDTVEFWGSNEKPIFKMAHQPNAVNYLVAFNGATTNAPQLFSLGDDANINLKLVPKGTGNLVVPIGNVPAYANDAAAAAGGVVVGGFYRIASALQIRVV